MIDPKQLKMGIEVESEEHKLGPELSKKIATDHLKEGIPDYYTRLAKMEAEAEEDDEDEGDDEDTVKRPKGNGYMRKRVKGAY